MTLKPPSAKIVVSDPMRTKAVEIVLPQTFDFDCSAKTVVKNRFLRRCGSLSNFAEVL